jgi:FixJ family two-component response regulator
VSNDAMIDEFKIEAFEMFEDAEECFLNIDKGMEFNSSYNRIFRSFHSLKGAAGMFGMIDLQSHMHKLESLLESQKVKGKFKKHQIDYFLKGLDAGKELLNGIQTNFVHIDLADFDKEDGTSLAVPEVKVLEASGPNTGKKLGTIFIVDDEPDIVDVLSRIIGEQDYVIHKFYNGEDALNAFEKLKPEVILSDIKMPKLDGVQMLKAISDLSTAVPVIFISGNLSKEKMQEALLYGAYAFIDKPFDNMVIATLCKNAIKKYRSMQLLEKSINYIIYQFNDLDEFLKSQGKESMRLSLKNELQVILEQRKILKESGKK